MELEINGRTQQIQAEPDTPLLWVIRDELGLTGTKYGCGLAQCGACTVLVDGVAVRSCVTPVEGVVGRRITTIEAVEADPVGQRVVEAWVKHQVPQCGYCQSGQVLTATALLKQHEHPNDDDIAAAMINLCRCGTYNAIKAAVHDLAGSSASAASVEAAPAPPHVPTVAAIALAAAGAYGVLRGETADSEDAEAGQ